MTAQQGSFNLEDSIKLLFTDESRRLLTLWAAENGYVTDNEFLDAAFNAYADMGNLVHAARIARSRGDSSTADRMLEKLMQDAASNNDLFAMARLEYGRGNVIMARRLLREITRTINREEKALAMMREKGRYTTAMSIRNSDNWDRIDDAIDLAIEIRDLAIATTLAVKSFDYMQGAEFARQNGNITRAIRLYEKEGFAGLYSAAMLAREAKDPEAEERIYAKLKRRVLRRPYFGGQREAIGALNAAELLEEKGEFSDANRLYDGAINFIQREAAEPGFLGPETDSEKHLKARKLVNEAREAQAQGQTAKSQLLYKRAFQAYAALAKAWFGGRTIDWLEEGQSLAELVGDSGAVALLRKANEKLCRSFISKPGFDLHSAYKAGRHLRDAEATKKFYEQLLTEDEVYWEFSDASLLAATNGDAAREAVYKTIQGLADSLGGRQASRILPKLPKGS